MGTPSDVPDELGDAEDRTSRVDPSAFPELPPLPVETAPGMLRLVPKPLDTDVSLSGARVDDLIGKHCGGYVIEALLGEGGMGKVYLANNARLGKRAAVKVLLPEHSRSPHVVDRFLQEAKTAAQIDDPNIIDVIDASELEGGRAYLLMPYVEGQSLEDLCERMGHMSLEVAATILLQICAGLDSAHKHGIIHRDIKPQNILVGRRQRREHFVRIVDFGIAKLLDPHLAGKFRTHTKALMGTPGYMAPEQARGERNIDGRADVYAVGVVAYRMLTGRRPYMDETLYALIEKQATNAPFPRPRELRPDLPPEWDEAIMAALSNNREKRLATVRELALRLARGIPDGDQMLRMLAPQLVESPLPPHAPTLDPFLDHDIARRTGSQRRQSTPVSHHGAGHSLLRQWPRALAVLALLLVGGLAGLGLSSRSPPPERLAESASPPAAIAPSWGPASSPAVAPSSTDPAESSPPASAPSSSAGAVPAPPNSSGSAASEDKPPTPSPSPSASEDADVAAAKAVEKPSPPAKPSRNSSTQTAAGASESKPPAGQLARDDSARLARLSVGVLVVKVQPWGLLSMNGARIGYAPLRKEMPAGDYTIHITSRDKRNEAVKVTISPGKVTTVERNFQ